MTIAEELIIGVNDIHGMLIKQERLLYSMTPLSDYSDLTLNALLCAIYELVP